LLLDAYRNTIELNTTLIERQEVITTGIEKILSELAGICGNQATMAAELAARRNDEVKEHAGLTMRLYAAFSLLGAMVLGLIGLLVKIWPTTPRP